MFHTQNGLFFEKQADGSVRILKTESGREGDPVLMDVTLDKHSWGSVIASMSYYGEEDYGFYRAMNFHVGEPIGETTPLNQEKLK